MQVSMFWWGVLEEHLAVNEALHLGGVHLSKVNLVVIKDSGVQLSCALMYYLLFPMSFW